MKFWVLLFAVSSLAYAQVPHSKHVWLITEENHSYESVIGNANMPYYNSLANRYALATQYYTEQHSSLPALMWLVAGQPVTSDNNTTACFNVNNVVRQVLAKGLRWKSYQVDLPYPGFQGLSSLNYLRRHNPLIYFSDACTVTQKLNSVPFTQLPLDMAANTTPNYIYITPNVDEDAHDGTLAAADTWLAQNVPAILARPEFKPGGDGLLFIVWDEGNLKGDDRCTSTIKSGCGGRTATIVIGPQVKPAYKSAVRYSHQNLLRTVCDTMEFGSCPGAGAVAHPMTDFFNTVNVSAPLPNAQVASPVHIQATTSNSSPITAIQIYVDNALRCQVNSAQVNTNLPMSAGKHYIVVQSWDKAGGIHKTGVNVTVQPQAVVVSSPLPNATVASPVPVIASGMGASAVRTMQVFVDGTLKYQVSGNTVNTNQTMSLGKHNIVVQATDQTGAVTRSTVTVNAARPSISLFSPNAATALTSPVQVSATTQDPTPVHTVQVYVDGGLRSELTNTGVLQPMLITPGSHSIMVQAWNTAGQTYKKGTTINVAGIPVTISSPTANATVTSPVAIKASVPSTSPVIAMQLYVDNLLKYKVNAKSVSTSLAMSTGKHYLVAQAWDSSGNTYKAGIYITAK
jgi:acid phosphatase